MDLNADPAESCGSAQVQFEGPQLHIRNYFIILPHSIRLHVRNSCGSVEMWNKTAESRLLMVTVSPRCVLSEEV
jgi:hypothetical protein